MLRRAWQDQSPGARSQLTPVNGYVCRSVSTPVEALENAL